MVAICAPVATDPSYGGAKGNTTGLYQPDGFYQGPVAIIVSGTHHLDCRSCLALQSWIVRDLWMDIRLRHPVTHFWKWQKLLCNWRIPIASCSGGHSLGKISFIGEMDAIYNCCIGDWADDSIYANWATDEKPWKPGNIL